MVEFFALCFQARQVGERFVKTALVFFSQALQFGAGAQVDDDFLPDNYPFDFEDRDNIFNDDDGDNLINTVV